MAKKDKNQKLNNDEEKDLLKKNYIPTRVDNNLQKNEKSTNAIPDGKNEKVDEVDEKGEEAASSEETGCKKGLKEKCKRACTYFGINHHLLFLKISLFVMYGGKFYHLKKIKDVEKGKKWYKLPECDLLAHRRRHRHGFWLLGVRNYSLRFVLKP